MIRRHGELPRAVLLLGDAIAAVAALSVAYWVRIESGWIALEGRVDVLPERYAAALPVAATLLLVAAWWAGLYARDALVRLPPLRDVVRTALVGGLLLGSIALLYWEEFQYSRLSIGIAATAYAPMIYIARSAALGLVRRLRAAGRFRTRVAVAGGGRPAERLSAAIAANPWTGVDVISVLPCGALPAGWTSLTRLDSPEALVEAVESGSIDEVYVAIPGDASISVEAVLQALDRHPVDVRLIPDVGELRVINPTADVLSGVPVVALRERPLFGVRAAAKRVFDLVFGAVFLLLLSPLMGLVAVAVWTTTGRPILFRQERMGLDGRPFEILKFRTMRHDAEAETGPVFSAPGDARVTSVGRWLRRLSLDELPQLWNVLRGDMSLVGPRPERDAFIREFRERYPAYMQRHAVKAGMTGWAQVHGLRGDTSIEERLRLDLEYVDRWSLLLDVEILGRTALHVLAGRNAY